MDPEEPWIREFWPRVYSLAYRMLGNAQDAQDAAQEAFLKALQHWETQLGPTHREGWVVRIARKALPERRELVAVVTRGDTLLLRRRPEGGLLGGLWEFPSVPDEGRGNRLLASFFRLHALSPRAEGSLGNFRHVFTHFRLQVEAKLFLAGRAGREEAGRRWVDSATLDELPVTRLTQRIHEAWRARTVAALPLFERT